MLTRRDGLKLTGAALASGAAFGLGGCSNKDAGMHIWEGEALGAPAFIKIHVNPDQDAETIFQSARAETIRLEKIFSLYDPNSEISRLNRDGVLENASSELLEVLHTARDISETTNGAFDITVQSLWKTAEYLTRANVTPAGRKQMWEEAYKLVDYRFVHTQGTHVSFTRPGIAITLNGIAQGFITDLLELLLISAGALSGLVNIGEFKAFGGNSWNVDIQDPNNILDIVETVKLRNQGLATSSSKGGYLGEHLSHIFAPRTGHKNPQFISASVIHRSATWADAFATAFTLMDEENIRQITYANNIEKVILVREDGEIIRF